MVKAKKRLHRRERVTALLFVLPPIIGFLVFTVGTMIVSVYFSFTNFSPLRFNTAFVGFDNYVNLFQHPVFGVEFKRSIWNTLFLMLSMPIGIMIGLLLSVITSSKRFYGKQLFKVLIYLPAVSSAVAINIVFRHIFAGDNGVLNQMMGRTVYWLGTDQFLIKYAIIIKNVWAGIGATTIMYLAGILAVGQEYYEAADIDGANAVTKFFKITFPMLTPITFYLVIMGIIGGLQSYIDSQVFAQGAPAARTVVFFIWQSGIDQNRYGLASAASIVLAIAIMIITIVQFKLSNRWVHED